MKRTILGIVGALLGGTLIFAGAYQQGHATGHDNGVIEGRNSVETVTNQDEVAFKQCMAYYKNVDHCFEDTIMSWQH